MKEIYMWVYFPETDWTKLVISGFKTEEDATTFSEKMLAPLTPHQP